MKRVLISIFLFCLIINLVSAVDITMQKTMYYPGETLQVSMVGGFIANPSADDISIYKIGNVHASSTEKGLIKDGDKFLFYAILPVMPGEYSLRIEGVNHYEGMTQTTDTIEKNFTIVGTNSSYLSFYPGYVQATKSFTVIIKAYNSQQNVDVEFAPLDFKQSYSLGYGDTRSILFSTFNLSGSIRGDIKINSYALPVIILINNSNKTQTTTNHLESIVEVSPSYLVDEGFNKTLWPGLDYSFKIEILNRISEPVDLEISSSDSEIKVSPTTLDNFDDYATLNVTINTEKDLNGYILINSSEDSIKIPIIVRVTKDETKVDVDTSVVSSGKTCSQYGGTKCNYNADESCDRETYASDGICCLSGCNAKGSGSGSYGWLWGLLLIAILVGIGWYVFKKVKENKKSPEEALHKRTEDYKRRMLLSSDEVTKSLTKE